jgi:phosphoenolpyruvate carboxylase
MVSNSSLARLIAQRFPYLHPLNHLQVELMP